MSIYQFESGHAVGINAIGTIRPSFVLSTITKLGVTAGAESTDAPEPSIFLEKSVIVTVSWHLSAPGAAPMLAPAPEPRPTRRGRAPAPVELPNDVDRGIMVGTRSVVISHTSGSLLESAEYVGLETYEDEKKSDIDYQSKVHRYIMSIGELHTKIRAAANDPVPLDDIMDDEAQSPQAVLDSRVVGLNKLLTQVGILGVEDVIDDNGGLLDVEGIYELRRTLASMDLVVEDRAIEDLITLPLIQARDMQESGDKDTTSLDDMDNSLYNVGH